MLAEPVAVPVWALRICERSRCERMAPGRAGRLRISLPPCSGVLKKPAGLLATPRANSTRSANHTCNTRPNIPRRQCRIVLDAQRGPAGRRDDSTFHPLRRSLDPRSIHGPPHYAQLRLHDLRHVVRMAISGPQPQMVDRWTVSDDKLSYTFTLRDGLKFHDAQPVRATDVVASLKRWGQRNDAYGQPLLAQRSPDGTGSNRSRAARASANGCSKSLGHSQSRNHWRRAASREVAKAVPGSGAPSERFGPGSLLEEAGFEPSIPP